MALTSYPLITLTNSGVANTKGTYTQIVAATPYASSRLFVATRVSQLAQLFFLMDIATGGAGSEVVLASNLAVNGDTDFITGAWVELDMDIPSGTRLSARQQSASAGSPSPAIGCLLDSRALAGLAAPVTYGAVTASTRGTQIDPGTTINTKGAYVQLTASTTARIDVVALCVTLGVSAQTISSFTQWQVDIATGASGSEVVVLPDVPYQANSVVKSARPGVVRLPVSIPAGTRLAARCQCDRNTAGERLLCVTLIGMQEPTTTGGGATSVAYLG